ncbi:hypothetical protein [Actibacterium sp. 188UL27-1]|uniref:hypothetical protein n=1 Tax=Actibacterium sp. 188UL27-1 TaxID=2786961 RepID=UPI001EF70C6C|nr:hypothetical protein [Actibacterium sp. 188UL27-1]
MYQTAEEVVGVVMDCIHAEALPVWIRTSDWAEDPCRFKTDSDSDGTQAQTIVLRDFLGRDVGIEAHSVQCLVDRC